MALEPRIGVVEVALHEEFSAGVVKVALHRVVLLSLLESLNNLGSNSLYLLFRNLELLVFLQGQLPLSFEVIPQNLDLLFDGIGLVHGRNEILLEFRILYLQSLHPGYRRRKLCFMSKVLWSNVKTLP